MTRGVIVDIDGTLFDASHRNHLALKKDWEGFQALSDFDTPIVPVIELVRALEEAGWCIVICTGRNERYRAKTVIQLAENGIHYDNLYMRPNGDMRSDTDYKLEKLGQIKEHWPEVSWNLAIEDRYGVVEMWRAQGLVCLQPQKGAY